MALVPILLFQAAVSFGTGCESYGVSSEVNELRAHSSTGEKVGVVVMVFLL